MGPQDTVQGVLRRKPLHAFEELARLKGKLGLNDAMVEKTTYAYRKAQEKRLTRGGKVDLLDSWCVHLHFVQRA